MYLRNICIIFLALMLMLIVAEGAPGAGAMDGDGVMETNVGIILM